MEETLHQAVGSKVKNLRLKAGLTLKQVAEKTDLSLGFLSQVERGKATLGTNSMVRVAQAFGVPISYFFESSINTEDIVIRSFERPFLQISSSCIQYYLCKDLENPIRPIVTELLPCDAEEQFASSFCHANEEFIYVLEGALTIRVNDTVYTLFPQDCIRIPANVEHAWCNKTNHITKLLSF